MIQQKDHPLNALWLRHNLEGEPERICLGIVRVRSDIHHH